MRIADFFLVGGCAMKDKNDDKKIILCGNSNIFTFDIEKNIFEEFL